MVDSGGKDRTPVRVTIANQSFTLVTSGDDREVIELAHMVDDLIASIAAKSGNVDTSRLAILACLHLADRLHTMEREFDSLKRHFEERTRHLRVLLDQVID